MDYDAIIVGAGLSGLTAGIRLAHFKKKVCILEKHSMYGGLNSYYKFRGRRFDTGLHAMSNFVPPGVKSAPLNRLLRQLRIGYHDFRLSEQSYSMIAFPECRLRFSNDWELFASEVERSFSGQRDNFHRLVGFIREYNDLDLSVRPISARKVVGEYITDPLLLEMLFCPLFFYGSAQELDMDFTQFVTMFKGIYLEGFARPSEGIKIVLDLLIGRYRESGGVLRLKSGVRHLHVRGNRVASVELDTGETLTADQVYSDAGRIETLKLCTDGASAAINPPSGRISVIESISVLNRQPRELGIDATIIFYNNRERFLYRRPESGADVQSGIICCPNNYRYTEPLPEGIIRIAHIASPHPWLELPENEYRKEKEKFFEESCVQAARHVPGFREHIILTDIFTPRTISRFTGRIDAALYGTPEKLRDGRTHLDNLFLIGTDQGFMGIIGAMLSGISIANLHGLQRSTPEHS